MFGFLDLYTTPRTVEIPTFNDTEVEGPEEFMLRLTQSTSPGSFVGDFQVIRGQTTVIIFDQGEGIHSMIMCHVIINFVRIWPTMNTIMVESHNACTYFACLWSLTHN